jgi:ferritin
LDRETPPELAGFICRQSDEEREHALRFAGFLVQAGARVAVPAIESPRVDIGYADAAL